MSTPMQRATDDFNAALNLLGRPPAPLVTAVERVTELFTALGDTTDKVAFSLYIAGITGRCGDTCGCPIANYLRAHGLIGIGVSPDEVTVLEPHPVFGRQRVYVTPPAAVADFIVEFDSETYPQLIQRGAR
jgi:hypothetical protein